MTSTFPGAPRARTPRRRSGLLATSATFAGALALVVGVLVAVSVTRPEAASADPPTVGQPGVLPAVDLNSLNPDPISQWGVVGVGNSYTAAKSLVWDFQEIGNRIYVAGMFLGVQKNGDDPNSPVITQSYLAAFDRDSGAFIPTFAPQLDRAVYALETSPDGKLLVGGEFTQVNGVARTGLVELDPDTGATIPAFRASINAGSKPMVRDILRVGSQIYIAGQISRVIVGSSQPFVWNAARLDATTGAYDKAWVPQFMGGIWQVAVDQSRGRVMAAGFFTSVAGNPGTARFASVTEATGAYIPGLTAFQPNSAGQQDTVAVVYADNKVFVGGAQHIIQVLNADTNTRVGYITSGFKCNAFSPDNCGYLGGGDIQTLEVAAGGTILGGCHCYYPGAVFSSFSNVRADNRFAIAVDASTGSVASTFVPGLHQLSVGTYAIFVDTRGCYYVGGDYTHQADGQWLGGFARFCRTVQPPVSLAGTSSNASVWLTWNAGDNQLPVAYYKVYRDGTFVGDTTNTTYTIPGLTAGTTPAFTVRTMDVAGRLSAPASVSVTITGPDTQAPNPPANFNGATTGTTVSLTWDQATDLPDPGGTGVASYRISRDAVVIATVPAGTTAYTDQNVANGTHKYEIRAIDAANNISAASPVVSVVVGAVDDQPPTVPTNVAATINGNSVTLTWGASTDLPDPGAVGLSGYLIHRDYQYLKFVAAGTTTITDTAVADGPHRYEVRAIDLGGRTSAPAPPVNITVGVPDTLAPTVPSGVSGAVNGASVTLTWRPSTDLPDPGGVGLSGYLIHRDYAYLKFVPAGTTTFTDLAPVSGSHKYQVRAVDKNNNISAAAPIVTVVVP